MADTDETQEVPLQPPPTSAAGFDAVHLARVLEEYMTALEAGGSPEHAKLCAAHPALATQLDDCLKAIDFIHGASRRETEGKSPGHLGDFRIQREVGRGGMGVVYEAEQVSLGRKVALKVLRVGGPADTEAMRRFQREAETVAALHHTNIVPIFAVGSERGVHYYAMQFINGRSLADLYGETADAATGRAPGQIADWGLQAAEALAHAHQRGVRALARLRRELEK